ncbi:MAG: hypothetical protein EAZ92_00990 [Candidatus Kapaibacterium sp.]|nr:MAG: hypothetical protein EAZ92_00990 [Candidatus Kapabacteria bacterium]
MKFLCLALCIALCALDACVPTVPAPPLEEGDWQLLVATDEPVSRLLLLSQPNNRIANQNLFLNVDSIRGIGGKVRKIALPTGAFREYVFVLMPEEFKIEVLSATSYRRITTISFANDRREPSDIIPVNATTAYIAFRNAPMLTVFDLFNIRIARDVRVGTSPISALDVIGNQLFCALQDENAVAVVATNYTGSNATEALLARIPVPRAPQFLAHTANGSELIVVCAGGGAQRLASRVAVVSIAERRVLREATLFSDAADSSNDRPYGLAITDRDFAYIPMNKDVAKVDVRSLARASVLPGVFRNVSFSPERLEIVLADSSAFPTCAIIASKNDSLTATISLENVRAQIRQINSR